MPEYLTTTESAKRLGVTVRRINQLCLAGRIGTRAPNGKCWIITAAEVAKFKPRPAGNPNFQRKKAGRVLRKKTS